MYKCIFLFLILISGPVWSDHWALSSSATPGQCEKDSSCLKQMTQNPPPILMQDSGVNGDGITNHNQPTFRVECTVGNRVNLYSDSPASNTLIGDSSCSGSPIFSIHPTDPLLDGTYMITYTETPIAVGGVESDHSEALQVTIDTVAPAAPNIVAPIEGFLYNQIFSAGSGTGDEGSQVFMYSGGRHCLSNTVGTDGLWSCNFPAGFGEGAHTLSTYAFDVADNRSDVVVTRFDVDYYPTVDPVFIWPAANGTVNTKLPKFIGTATPNDTLYVTGELGEDICRTIVQSDGSWECRSQIEYANGPARAFAYSEDSGQNQSNTVPVDFQVDDLAIYDFIITYDGSELYTTEMGGEDEFTIRLTQAPAYDVNIAIFSTDMSEGTVVQQNIVLDQSNWNQPIEVSVQGQDDEDTDGDQEYTIGFSLDTLDQNFPLVIPQINAVNFDDELPDLKVTISNCQNGVNEETTYFLDVTNVGNMDVSNVRVTSFPGEYESFNEYLDLSWTCDSYGGSVCPFDSGTGNIDEIVDLPVGAAFRYKINAIVDAPLNELIRIEGAVELLSGINDINPQDNNSFDEDEKYPFISQSGFDCLSF